MQEHWKPIRGYKDYLISDLGFIRSLKFGRLKNIIGYEHNKYLSVKLRNNGISKSCNIHKLVAIAFLNHIPNGYDLVIDHINKDTLDNRVCNLRMITHRENVSRTKRGSSKYTGVHWCNTGRRWHAKIQINKKRIHLGSFKNEIDAYNAYQKKLKTLNHAKSFPR